MAEKLGQRAHHQDEHHQQRSRDGKLQVVRFQVLNQVSARRRANSLQHTMGFSNTTKDAAVASLVSCSSRSLLLHLRRQPAACQQGSSKSSDAAWQAVQPVSPAAAPEVKACCSAIAFTVLRCNWLVH